MALIKPCREETAIHKQLKTEVDSLGGIAVGF